jgi:hypothetical protein
MKLAFTALIVAALAAAPIETFAAPADGPDLYGAFLAQQSAATVSGARIKGDVEKLASFGTRHTLSDTASPTRGIGAARNWIKAEFEKIAATSEGRMTVSFEEFDAPEGKRIPKGGAHVVNVMAVLKGHGGDGVAERRVYIVGHYDSRNADEMDAAGDAPGANDDASGTAAVLEAARALAPRPLATTVVFLATAGEEQGLLGAQFRASTASAAKENIIGVLNNDIVGDPGIESGGQDNLVRVFSEGLPRNPSAERLSEIRNNCGESDSASRQLARFVEETGFTYRMLVGTRLVMRQDRLMRGGDHIPFNDAGFPAVRFTSGGEVYDRQHANVTTKDGRAYGDVPVFVKAAYLEGVTKLNVATIVRLAMAPGAPEEVRVVTDKPGEKTVVRWTAPKDARAVKYEVVWRDTTEPRWTHSMEVATGTEATVDASKDDNFFGVRSVSPEGHKGVVVFAVGGKK